MAFRFILYVCAPPQLGQVFLLCHPFSVGHPLGVIKSATVWFSFLALLCPIAQFSLGYIHSVIVPCSVFKLRAAMPCCSRLVSYLRAYHTWISICRSIWLTEHLLTHLCLFFSMSSGIIIYIPIPVFWLLKFVRVVHNSCYYFPRAVNLGFVFYHPP